jgi:hypothetical protein
MGTWGTGPFDNDTAADFSDDLDDAASLSEREDLIRGVLARTVKATGYLTEAEEAVAAAALIAAQRPGGEPVGSVYGPKQSLPAFPEGLRELAAEALDRIMADESGLSGTWVNPVDARQWLSSIKTLRDVLDPPSASLEVPLFDL